MAKGMDTLPETKDPDRVNYATGVLLAAEDFQAEQDYHRSRLARALAYAIGYGTVAGLRVNYEAEQEATETQSYRPERILIEPGLGIDRLGRLLEVTSTRCLKLDTWYRSMSPQILRDSWQDSNALWTDSPAGVVVDVFIRFYVCEQGKTPSFASDAFDTFDSVVAARLRDGFELEMVPRQETTPPMPESAWPDFANDVANLREAIYNNWKQTTSSNTAGGLNPLNEHVAGQDSSSIFLARLIIPADSTPPGERPARREGENVVVRNELRPFVVTANALARWLELAVTAQS